MLRARLSGVMPQLSELRESSRRMVDLLPARLRDTSRWLAAGAVAGALGCVAAATLVAPAAIVALPAWAGVGAALGDHRPARLSKQAPPDEPIDLTDAVNAALFAIVLELQGRDETEITRIIDRVAGEEEPTHDARFGIRPRLARHAARPPRPGAASRSAGAAMSPKLPVLKAAIVGHTNTGKTSLVRTLTRDAEFGEVSDRPATTRHVEGTVLLIERPAAGRTLRYARPGGPDRIAGVARPHARQSPA